MIIFEISKLNEQIKNDLLKHVKTTLICIKLPEKAQKHRYYSKRWIIQQFCYCLSTSSIFHDLIKNTPESLKNKQFYCNHPLS